MKCIILLTATITPNGMIFTSLQDPLEREKQYMNSLMFYLENTNCQIIFCENTEYRLDNRFDKYIKNNRLEFLSFDGNNYDKSLGKGYGEALIIEYALNNSRFIKNSSDTLIYKITGRIIIKNIQKLLCKTQKPKSIYTEYRRKGIERIRSVCFAAPVHFFKYLVDKKNKIDDSNGIYFENILRTSILSFRNEKSYYHRIFPLPIKQEDMSGTYSTPHKSQSYYKWFFCWCLHKYHTYVRHL